MALYIHVHVYRMFYMNCREVAVNSVFPNFAPPSPTPYKGSVLNWSQTPRRQCAYSSFWSHLQVQLKGAWRKARYNSSFHLTLETHIKTTFKLNNLLGLFIYCGNSVLTLD